jgi:hypothetical protein
MKIDVLWKIILDQIIGIHKNYLQRKGSVFSTGSTASSVSLRHHHSFIARQSTSLYCGMGSKLRISEHSRFSDKKGWLRNIQDNAITVRHICVQTTQFTYFNELCNLVSRLLITKPVHGYSSVLDNYSYKWNIIAFVLKRQPNIRKYFVLYTNWNWEFIRESPL